MNTQTTNSSTKQKINIYKQYSQNTCPLFFSWDTFFEHTLFVAIYLLVFRLFFTFLFAFLMVQQWHIEKMWGWFPIVAFNSDMDTFTKMNSYAVVVTGVTVMLFYMFQIFAHYQPQRKYKIYAWYIGVLMLLVQYVVLILINNRLRFSIDTNLWWFFIGIIFLATVMLYLWYRFVRQWKFRQYFKKQQKLERQRQRQEQIKNKQKEQQNNINNK
jgi:hypothetical protein